MPDSLAIHSHHMHALNPRAIPAAAGIGLLAAAIMLGFYFGILTLVSGWEFTLDQFNTYWPFVIALAVGFGIQVGQFMYLHRAAHAAASSSSP